MQNEVMKYNNHNKITSINSAYQFFTMIIFTFIVTGLNAQTDPDDLIFENSFEEPDNGSLIFLTSERTIFDQPKAMIKVRASRAQSSLVGVNLNNSPGEVISQDQMFLDYQFDVELNEGENTITAVADYGLQIISADLTVFYYPPISIDFTSPSDWQTLGPVNRSGNSSGGALNLTGAVERPVTIIGTTTRPVRSLTINQQEALRDGNNFSFENYFLHEGSNLINATALDEYGRQTTASITVYVDQTAPFIILDDTFDRITSANTINLTGTVNDAVEGDFNAPDVLVSISNLATGKVHDAVVNGINFLAMEIDLAVGENKLLITGADAFGNERSVTTSVNRIDVGTNRLSYFAGNNQSAPVNERLFEPLHIAAFDSAGLPLSGVVVHFDVVKGSGNISTEAGVDVLIDGVNPARNLVIQTDESGEAMVWLTLGAEAGLASHVIKVWSDELSESVYFTASSLAGEPNRIVIEDGSGTQYAQTNTQPLHSPTVMVLDENDNPLAATPVKFTVLAGDAYFETDSAIGGVIADSGATITTFTDKKGQASIRPLLGATPGITRITAQAINMADEMVGNTEFQIIVLERSDEETRFSGLVMDMSGYPLEGVSLSFARTNFTTLTDAQGQFYFQGDLPIGRADLFIDGRDVTAEQNGQQIEYPALHFETTIIEGQDNQLPHIIYLPPVHTERAQEVGGSEDVSLTIPGFDGFEMVVKAGSVTFPDGSRVGDLVVNPVHADRLPMVPPGGAGRFSPFGWTIQPTGTRFDPPIEVKMPNVDGLKPGIIRPIVQWDHDLAQFVPMGLGTVGADGTQVVSNPGSGITKAGWGGGPPPPPPTNDGNNPDEDEGEPRDPDQDPEDDDTSESDQNPNEEADPITLSTGEFKTSITDLRIKGRGFDFEFIRTYRSQFTYNGPIGENWNHNHNEQLVIEADQVRYSRGDGRMDTFIENPDGSFQTPSSLYLRLMNRGNEGYLLRDRYGFRTLFDTEGLMTARIDRMGNRMDYRYDDLNRLIEITDTLGRKIQVNYYSSHRIRSILDFSGREVTYSYDGNGDLVSVRSPIVVGTSTGNDFPEGLITRYTYSSGLAQADLNHNLLTITDPKNQTYLINTYGDTGYEFDKVIIQQEGEQDQTYELSYIDVTGGSPDRPNEADNQVTLTDRAGNTEVHVHNARGNLLEKRELTNRNINPMDDDEYITRHRYDINGERVQTTYPEGNQVQWAYDSSSVDPLRRGNLLRVTQIAGPRGASQATLEQAYQYEPIFNQMVSSIDARAFASEFVPPNGGAVTDDRYKNTYRFDYQEATSIAQLVRLTGLSAADLLSLLNETNVELNLGDLNGDNITNQLNGHHVVKIKPDATGFDGVPQSIQSEYQYNGFGQLIATIDPEGHVDEYRYYAEIDPGGSGNNSDSDRLLDIVTGGHLRKKVRDAATSPRRGNLPLERISTTLRYNQVGQVTQSTDGRGNTTLIERNALDRPIKITAPAPFSYTHQLHYDANGNVIRREVENTDTNGPGLDESVTTLFTYDMLDNPVQKREEVATGQFITTVLAYDANENPILLTKGEGNQVSRIMDERDLTYSVTKGFGSSDASTIRRTYDGNGNLTLAADAGDNNNDGEVETTEISYDGYDRFIARRDAVGNLVELSYDPVNNITSQQKWGPRGGVSPDNNVGANNVLLSQAGLLYDELNRMYQVDQAFLDAAGNPAQDGSLTPGDGLVSHQFSYDRSSRLVTRIDDNSHQTNYQYDGLDRQIQYTDALGNIKTHRYDQNSNLVQIIQTEIDPAGVFDDEIYQWHIEYDVLNRTTQVIDNLNNITQGSYDSRHNLIEKIDALNNISSYVYDGQDRLLQTTDQLSIGGAGGSLDTSNPDNSDGLINEWLTYDDNSRITALIDDNNNSTAYSYDELDRLTRKNWPDDTFEQYSYDADHNMTQLIDPNGSVHDVEYDGINRLVDVDITRASGIIGTTQLSYQYDGLNRRTRLEDNNNPAITTDDWVIEVGYDSLNNATSQNQNGQLVSSVFDGVGNHLNLTYPSGRSVNRSYDQLDRLFNITDGDNNTLITSYSYMGKNRVSERNHGNGTTMRMHDGEVMNGYDELKRVVGITHSDASGALISEFVYGYDAVGNRRFESEQTDPLVPAVSKLFELDSGYRVQRSLTGSNEDLSGIINNNITNSDLSAFGQGQNNGLNKNYRIDGAGNWRNLTESGTASSNTDYVVNELNQYEQIGADAQVHDADGNLTADGDRILRYDALDRLVEVIEQGNLLASFTYDALSRRVSKTSGSQTTFYYHDRYEVIEEQNQNNETLRTYVQGRLLDEMIQMQTQDETYYYHGSAQLSIAAITDSTGTVVERYRYGDFGQTEVLDASGNLLAQSAIGNPFGYTGRRLDVETGYYYYRARFYDPVRGRFLNRDPIGYLAGMNLYSYVLNNPLTWIDPFGLDKGEPEPWTEYCDNMGSCVMIPPQTDIPWDQVDEVTDPMVDFFTEDIENVWNDVKNGEIDLQTAIDLGLAICKLCKAGDKFGDLAKKACSFEGETPVLTSEGYKPISEVEVGDYVWSKNEDNTGEWSWKPVTDVYSHLHTDGLTITVLNQDGTSTDITTTSEHPFFTGGDWLRADQLQEGMLLSTPDSQLQIAVINWLNSELPAYNMTVGQSHTYTVGEQQVWVHNACDSGLDIDLPKLDGTGKVHGDLPSPKDLNNYQTDNLRELKRQLETSVQQRIKKNIELGHDKSHSQRQAAEQQLIKSIEKALKNRG